MNEKEKKLPTFADFLAAGLQDSEDVQQVVCGLLIDLCANLRLSGVLLNQMDRVVEPLERMVQKNSKQVQSKQNLNIASDMLRCFARTIRAMVGAGLNQLHKGFGDFVLRAQKDPIFVAAYEGAGAKKT